MRHLAVAALIAATPTAARDAASPDVAHVHGGRTLTFTQVEADYSRQQGGNVVNWDAEGWIGGDIHKFWWKSEGENRQGHFETAEFQALYSRNVWSFFDAQAGVRTDVEPDARSYGVIGVQGLAPGLLETELHAFFGFRGDVSVRLKQSVDIRMTNRFVLQPLFETDLYLTDVPERRIGTGFSSVETGVQARYELTRKFAPTLAVVYESKLGETARLAQADGEDSGGWSVRGGVTVWF